MNSYDYYAVAKKIARRLSKDGYPNWSDRILDAIACGSTATEILMAIRWQLNEFKNSQSKISDPIKKEIVELTTKIDEVLK